MVLPALSKPLHEEQKFQQRQVRCTTLSNHTRAEEVKAYTMRSLISFSFLLVFLMTLSSTMTAHHSKDNEHNTKAREA